MPDVRTVGVDDAGQLPPFFAGVFQFMVEGLGGRGLQAEVLPLLLGADQLADLFRHRDLLFTPVSTGNDTSCIAARSVSPPTPEVRICGSAIRLGKGPRSLPSESFSSSRLVAEVPAGVHSADTRRRVYDTDIQSMNPLYNRYLMRRPPRFSTLTYHGAFTHRFVPTGQFTRAGSKPQPV